MNKLHPDAANERRVQRSGHLGPAKISPWRIPRCFTDLVPVRLHPTTPPSHAIFSRAPFQKGTRATKQNLSFDYCLTMT